MAELKPCPCRCGYANVYCNKKRMDYYLTGRNDPPKNVIDKILMVTGLTYEQAFSK